MMDNQVFDLLMKRFDTLEDQNESVKRTLEAREVKLDVATDKLHKLIEDHIVVDNKIHKLVERHSVYFSIAFLGLPVIGTWLAKKSGFTS